MNYKNSSNAASFPKNYEKNLQPSMTIPDQSMSVKEIMNRFARGLGYEGAKVPIYDGEDQYFPDPKTMDLADRASLAQQYREEINELTKPKQEPPVTQSQETIEPAS